MMGFYKMETVSAVNLFNLNKSACLSEDLEMEKAVVDICSEEEFHAILVREKARADRNGHGFSLVAVDISNHENVSSLQKSQTMRMCLRYKKSSSSGSGPPMKSAGLIKMF
jgi:hypothetical protein